MATRTSRLGVMVAALVTAAVWPGFAAEAAGATAASTTAASPAPSGEPGGTWGEPQAIAGIPRNASSSGITSVSCASPGNCSAVGWWFVASANPTITGAFVLGETGGVWGAARQIPGLGTAVHPQAAAISCAAAGDCGVAGTFQSKSGQAMAFVASETDGAWGQAQEIAGIPASLDGSTAYPEVTSISCAAPGNCTAVGNYASAAPGSPQLGFLVGETDGTWGTAQAIPGIASLVQGAPYETVAAVSCGAAGSCTAGGSYGDGSAGIQQAFVVNQTAGGWGNAEEVPGLSDLGATEGSDIESLSCTAAGSCVGGGYYGTASAGEAFVADETGGTWGNAQEVPGAAALSTGNNAFVASVSCPSAGNCAATGIFDIATADSEGSGVFVVSQAAGTWGSAKPISGLASSTGENAWVTELSCGGAGNCVVGGQYYDGAGEVAFVADEAGGVWGGAHRVPGRSQVETVSCTAPGYCSAGGNGAFVVNEATASTTRLTPRLAKLIYGDEQAERLSVTVTSPRGGTPSGTVTVTTGNAKVCTITLASGTGSCKLSAARLPAGKYHLTATYGGDISYVVSSSAPTTVTVSRAASKTSLALARTTISYGHESAERLSVTVISRFGGAPGGKVTVKAGKTTICVVTLSKAGKGTCKLTARQLKAGTYTLTASYHGSPHHLASTSAKKTLRVAR
jgi:hypothetical protein